MSRVHNFCAGPCTLPVTVLDEVQAEFLDFAGSGMSVIEMSHRSTEYDEVHEEALGRFREIFEVPDGFEIVFMQGGATLLFSAVPMNLLGAGERAGYVRSGTWGKGAVRDAAFHGDVYVAWDGEPHGFARMPREDEIDLRDGSRYLHVTSNETIEGIRMVEFPSPGIPLVADMSSDYVSRPIPWDRFDLVYGGAQKNLGPAGLAVAVVRQDAIVEREIGSYLRFKQHAAKRSLMNTPPMFAIYVMCKVLGWIRDQGGVRAMEERARRRSGMVYQAIDESGGFYRSPVEWADRSLMNVVFRTPSNELDAAFLKGAEAERLMNLKGHRSVGGMRASIYNAMTDEGVEALVGHMRGFAEAYA